MIGHAADCAIDRKSWLVFQLLFALGVNSQVSGWRWMREIIDSDESGIMKLGHTLSLWVFRDFAPTV